MTIVARHYTKDPVGSHSGLGNWLMQRATAVVMALYTLGALACLAMQRPDSYAAWKALFAGGFARISTFIFFAALAWHAWIGMRDIFIDYVQVYGVRLMLQAAVTVVLAGYVVWAAAVLWGLQP